LEEEVAAVGVQVERHCDWSGIANNLPNLMDQSALGVRGPFAHPGVAWRQASRWLVRVLKHNELSVTSSDITPNTTVALVQQTTNGKHRFTVQSLAHTAFFAGHRSSVRPRETGSGST
jgi:hypothetical protein